MKFQLDRSMFSQVIAENAKCEMKKKKRNYFKILLARISGLTGAICLKFGM